MDLLNTKKIIDLYIKYKNELQEVGDAIRSFLDENNEKGFTAQCSDIECEMTYMFLRELNPNNVVEFSPCQGYSSIWILHALNKNNNGYLFSFDLIDDSSKFIPSYLGARRIFFKGDVKLNISKFPKSIDYVFIDSDHGGEFCDWYIKNIFPLIRSGIYISVHDVVRRKTKNGNILFGEGRRMLSWFKENNVKYFSVGLKNDIGDLDMIDPHAREIIDIYRKTNLKTVNVYGKIQRNSAVFFRMN